MASTHLSVKYRPVRIGFLVEDGSVDDLVKTAGLNTLLWGGIHNPIIPVKKGGLEFAEQLIKLFNVDILYSVSKTEEIDELVKKYRFLRDPGHYGENLFYEDWHSKKKIMAFLDSKRIVDFFWDKEFKQKPKTYKSNFTLVHWSDDDPIKKLLSLQFGYFPRLQDIDFKYDYEKGFLNGLHAKEVTLDKDGEISVKPRKEYSQIESTSAELTGYATGARANEPGIFIGKSDNFNDLVDFWNLRASGIQTVFFATDYEVRTLPFAQRYIDFLDNLPNRHPNYDDWISIYHNIDDNQIVTDLIAKISHKKRLSINHVSEHSWNGLNVQPLNYVFKWKQTIADVEKLDDHYSLTVRLPEKQFIVEDDIESHSQYVGVTIDTYSEFGYPGHTLKVPFIKELEEFYSREICFDPWAIKVEKEGIASIQKVSSDSITLYPIPNQKLIEKILEFRDLTVSMSQAGLLTKRIIEKIKGLEGGRFLKIKGVRKLLQENKSTDLLTRGGATKIINENDFTKHERLFIEARDKPKLTADQVFEYLLKNDLFRAGLELQCENCKLWDWLALKKLDDYWACEFCGESNRTSTQLKNRGDWKFRKSGLFAKDNNQEGAIPVILTLLTLVRVLDHSDFKYSPALKLDGTGVNCETDFVILLNNNNRRSEVQIGIGECKSQGGSITRDDINKFEAVYNKIKDEGKMECYLIFSKTDDSFTTEEISLFDELNKKNIPLVLFTNKELELYHPYWQEDGGIDPDIPVRYPNSLEDLWRNSIARYLIPIVKVNSPTLTTE